jgi:hypothetical protein
MNKLILSIGFPRRRALSRRRFLQAVAGTAGAGAGLLWPSLASAAASAEDHIAVLNGTMYKIDQNGNLWRQNGAFWVEVSRIGAWKNTQRMSASPSDNLLIVLQNNWLHAVSPNNGGYKVLTRGITYEPRKMTGLCGLNGFAYFIFRDTLCRVRLDGTGGLEPVRPENRWPNTEAMASNLKSMIISQGGVLHRLNESGGYKIICRSSLWDHTTSIYPASEERYIVTQRGVKHLVSDVDGEGQYILIE